MSDTPKSPAARRRLGRLPAGTRTYALVAAGVLVLAAVMFGVSALSSPRSSFDQSQIPVSSAFDKSRAYAQQAEAALRRGETTRAVELLRQAVAADPSNTQAQGQLQQIHDSQNPPARRQDRQPVNPSNNATKTGPDPFLSPVADLAKLLPASVTGYDKGSVLRDSEDAELSFDPTSKAPAGVTRALFSVHDRGSVSAASAFVSQTIPNAYSREGATVTIHDVNNGYFGGNGQNVFTVAFSRGRFAFEVNVTVVPGTGTASAKSAAAAAASAFPTKL
jgi:hypothetical protein